MPARSSALRDAGHRPDPHDRGVDAGDGRGHDPGHRRQPERPGPLRLDQQHGGAPSLMPELLPAVTEPALVRKAGRSLASASMRRVRPRMLVARDDRSASPFRPVTSTGTICSSNRPASIAAIGALLALQREGVLLLAADAPPLGDVLGGLAHRVGVVLLGQARVDEPPAQRRVDEPRAARASTAARP